MYSRVPPAQLVSELTKAQEVLGRHGYTDDYQNHFQHGQQKCRNKRPEHFLTSLPEITIFTSTFKNHNGSSPWPRCGVEAQELRGSGGISLRSRAEGLDGR